RRVPPRIEHRRPPTTRGHGRTPTLTDRRQPDGRPSSAERTPGATAARASGASASSTKHEPRLVHAVPDCSEDPTEAVDCEHRVTSSPTSPTRRPIDNGRTTQALQEHQPG